MVELAKFVPQVMVSLEVFFERNGSLHFVNERVIAYANCHINDLLPKLVDYCHC